MAGALNMKCPNCGKVSPNKVLETDSKHLCLGDDRRQLFERIIGRDIYFRRRYRYCEECCKAYDTAEFPSDVLFALVEEIDRLNEMIKIERLVASQVTKLESGLLSRANDLNRVYPYLELRESVFGTGDERTEEMRLLLSEGSLDDLQGFVAAGDAVISTLSNEEILALDRALGFLDETRRADYEARVPNMEDVTRAKLEKILRKLRHPTRNAMFQVPSKTADD